MTTLKFIKDPASQIWFEQWDEEGQDPILKEVPDYMMDWINTFTKETQPNLRELPPDTNPDLHPNWFRYASRKSILAPFKVPTTKYHRIENTEPVPSWLKRLGTLIYRESGYREVKDLLFDNPYKYVPKEQMPPPPSFPNIIKAEEKPIGKPVVLNFDEGNLFYKIWRGDIEYQGHTHYPKYYGPVDPALGEDSSVILTSTKGKVMEIHRDAQEYNPLYEMWIIMAHMVISLNRYHDNLYPDNPYYVPDPKDEIETIIPPFPL